jgi:hypothetical protein
MTIKFPKFFGLLAFAGVFALTPAFAVNVNFTTSGTFSGCGAGYTCAGDSLTSNNGIKILYTGEDGSDGPYTVPPITNITYGYFQASGNPPAGKTDTLAANFTLDIFQTEPPVVPNTEVLIGALSGTIKISNSTAVMNFTSATGAPFTIGTDPIGGAPAIAFTLGNEEYWVDTTLQISPATKAGKNGQESPIVGSLTAVRSSGGGSGTPEPSFYLLTGMGLAGLFATAIRRKKQAA